MLARLLSEDFVRSYGDWLFRWGIRGGAAIMTVSFATLQFFFEDRVGGTTLAESFGVTWEFSPDPAPFLWSAFVVGFVCAAVGYTFGMAVDALDGQ